MEEAARLGASWFYIAEAPSGAAIDVPAVEVVLGVPAGALQARRGAVVRERLDALGVARCAGVMLREVNPGAVKAGGPFHRLSQLRDAGTVDLFFAEAEDYATGEWLLHHTPAHAVAVPFSLNDLTAKYRLLRDAAGFGTGVIARPARSAWTAPRAFDAIENVSFLAGEEAVTAMLLPLPDDVNELRRILDALMHPMPEAERAWWWEAFRRQVPEPPPPPRGVAPDFA
jgi:hypothetical protein